MRSLDLRRRSDLDAFAPGVLRSGTTSAAWLHSRVEGCGLWHGLWRDCSARGVSLSACAAAASLRPSGAASSASTLTVCSPAGPSPCVERVAAGTAAASGRKAAGDGCVAARTSPCGASPCAAGPTLETATRGVSAAAAAAGACCVTASTCSCSVSCALASDLAAPLVALAGAAAARTSLHAALCAAWPGDRTPASLQSNACSAGGARRSQSRCGRCDSLSAPARLTSALLCGRPAPTCARASNCKRLVCAAASSSCAAASGS